MDLIKTLFSILSRFNGIRCGKNISKYITIYLIVINDKNCIRNTCLAYE